MYRKTWQHDRRWYILSEPTAVQLFFFEPSGGKSHAPDSIFRVSMPNSRILAALHPGSAAQAVRPLQSHPTDLGPASPLIGWGPNPGAQMLGPKSRATDLGPGNPLIGWGPKSWGPNLGPRIWNPEIHSLAGAQILGPRSWGPNPGAQMSRTTDLGPENALTREGPQVLGPKCLGPPSPGAQMFHGTDLGPDGPLTHPRRNI